MTANADWHDPVISLLKADAQRVEAVLRAFLRRDPLAPPKLIEAIEYSLLAGGKRLRPALVLQCFRACASATGSSAGEKSALAAAGAIELIHTFSLVHDDLPAMDDDDLRRGKPTNHKVFGEAMAILAGDAMTTLAFELIASDAEPGRVAPLVRELAQAAGPAGMIGGQVLDIASENQTLDLKALQQIHRMKTGALLTTSCRLGAICAQADHELLDAVSNYGQHLGLAFQIIDDVLDVTSTPERLGKATGKDAGKGKNTYPALLGLEPSRAEAQKQLELSIASLAPLRDAAKHLIFLAKFVVERQS